jgi:molecular chaperone DnaK
MVYQAEKTLSENEDKIPEPDKEAVRTAIAEARTELEKEDPTGLDAIQQRLEQALHKVAETLYKASQAEGAGAGDAGGPGAEQASSDDDVVDAEYTEEKGDEKGAS